MNKKFLKLLTFILTCALLISIATFISAADSSKGKVLPSFSTTVVNPICKDETTVDSKTFYSTKAITLS